jgi:hypothetical protein
MHHAFKLAIVAAFVLAAALPFARGPTAALAYPGADALYVSEACNPDGTLQVYIGWTTYGLGPQFLDLSQIDNGFQPGTFGTHGPVAPTVNSISWVGIAPATNFYLRVNTQTAGGWAPSATIGFSTRTCPIVAPVVVPIPAPVVVPVPVPFPQPQPPLPMPMPPGGPPMPTPY